MGLCSCAMDIPRGRGRPPRSRPPRKELIQRALRNLEVAELRQDEPDGEPWTPAELRGRGEEAWRALVRRPTSLLDLSWNGEHRAAGPECGGQGDLGDGRGDVGD